MATAQLTTFFPIPDVAALIAHFPGDTVKVRDGGPTQLWKRVDGTWVEEPNAYNDCDCFTPEVVEFFAYVRQPGTSVEELVGGDGMPFVCTLEEGAAWIAHLKSDYRHRYIVEDTGSSGIWSFRDGRKIATSLKTVFFNDFAFFLDDDNPFHQRLAAWQKAIQAAGADTIGMNISTKN